MFKDLDMCVLDDLKTIRECVKDIEHILIDSDDEVLEALAFMKMYIHLIRREVMKEI